MKLLNMIKATLYFIPFIIGFSFYLLIAITTSISTTSINPIAWVALFLLLISGILMYLKKWWGSVLGIVVGLLLIYMGLQETGQIIKETLFGVVLIVYYMLCGFISSKDNARI